MWSVELCVGFFVVVVVGVSSVVSRIVWFLLLV